MSYRNIVSIDAHTGEQLEDGIAVWVGRKIRSPYGRLWMQVNQGALETLAADKEMTGEAMRVFLYLNSRLDFENYIRVPQIDIGTALDLRKQNVNRAIKLLERKGIIIPGPKVDKSSVWRLNPHYGWKGKVVTLQKATTDENLRQVRKNAERLKAAASQTDPAEPSAASAAEKEAAGQLRLPIMR